MPVSLTLPPDHPSGFRFTAADIKDSFGETGAAIEQIEFVTLAELIPRFNLYRGNYPKLGEDHPCCVVTLRGTFSYGPPRHTLVTDRIWQCFDGRTGHIAIEIYDKGRIWRGSEA